MAGLLDLGDRRAGRRSAMRCASAARDAVGCAHDERGAADALPTRPSAHGRSPGQGGEQDAGLERRPEAVGAALESGVHVRDRACRRRRSQRPGSDGNGSGQVANQRRDDVRAVRIARRGRLGDDQSADELRDAAPRAGAP